MNKKWQSFINKYHPSNCCNDPLFDIVKNPDSNIYNKRQEFKIQNDLEVVNIKLNRFQDVVYDIFIVLNTLNDLLKVTKIEIDFNGNKLMIDPKYLYHFCNSDIYDDGVHIPILSELFSIPLLIVALQHTHINITICKPSDLTIKCYQIGTNICSRFSKAFCIDGITFTMKIPVEIKPNTDVVGPKKVITKYSDDQLHLDYLNVGYNVIRSHISKIREHLKLYIVVDDICEIILNYITSDNEIVIPYKTNGQLVIPNNHKCVAKYLIHNTTAHILGGRILWIS